MVNVKDGTEKIPRAERVLFGSQHRLSILNLEFNKFGFWYICVSHTPHKLKRPDKSKIRTKKNRVSKKFGAQENIEEEYYEDSFNKETSLVDDMYRASMSFNQT